ncbi:MAG: LEA type 2 family protein [Bacteroidota bacterium]|nr:LEA type 2 family protein [Bacteroidota bacterium]
MKRNFELILFIAIVLMSCSSPKALEYKDYRNFSIKSLGFNNSTVNLDLEYYNPNNFRMQLKNTNLDIFIDGKLLGHSSTDTLINIPRRDTFSLPVQFDINMQSFYQNALNTLLGKEVLLRIQGKIKVGKANIFMYFPVNYESKETFSLF